MSHRSSNFYPVDQFAFDYHLTMDRDSAPRRFLGDVSISFDSSFTSGWESTGVFYPGNYRYFSGDTRSYQESVGLVPCDSIFLPEETPGPIGIMPPLEGDIVRRPGEIPIQDTHSPAKYVTWKRTLGELNQEAKLKKIGQKWEKMDESCSVRQIKGAAPEYRCDLCHKAKRKLITNSHGDMKRHLQSIAH